MRYQLQQADLQGGVSQTYSSKSPVLKRCF